MARLIISYFGASIIFLGYLQPPTDGAIDLRLSSFNTTTIIFQVISETQDFEFLNADCLDPASNCPSAANFTTGLNQVFTGLSPGTRYGWEIYTRDAAGTSFDPTPTGVTPTNYICTQPLPPNSIIQLTDDKTDEVSIAWADYPSYNYEARYARGHFEQVTPGSNQHTFTGLVPNMCQDVSVRAIFECRDTNNGANTYYINSEVATAEACTLSEPDTSPVTPKSKNPTNSDPNKNGDDDNSFPVLLVVLPVVVVAAIIGVLVIMWHTRTESNTNSQPNQTSDGPFTTRASGAGSYAEYVDGCREEGHGYLKPRILNSISEERNESVNSEMFLENITVKRNEYT